MCGYKLSDCYLKDVNLLYLYKFIYLFSVVTLCISDFSYSIFAQFHWWWVKGLIAIVGLGSSQPLAPVLTFYIICSVMVIYLLKFWYLQLIHPLQWRILRLYMGMGVYKIFTNVLQKLVFYLNISSNQAII